MRKDYLKKEQTCALLAYPDFIPDIVYYDLYRAAESFIRGTYSPCFLIGGNANFDKGCVKVIRKLRAAHIVRTIRLVQIVPPRSSHKDYLCDDVIVCSDAFGSSGKRVNRIIKQYMIDQSSGVLTYFGDAPLENLKLSPGQWGANLGNGHVNER